MPVYSMLTYEIGLRNYEQLCTLLGGKRATGEFSTSTGTSRATLQKRARAMTDSDDEAVDNNVTSATATTEESQAATVRTEGSQAATVRTEGSQAATARTEGSQAAAAVSTDENEDTQKKPPPKRKRRGAGQGGTTGEQLLTAVTGLQETAEKSRQERSRQVKPRGARGDAVSKLDSEYPEFSGTKLADGYDLFQDAAKAEVFVRMKKGAGQDTWLRRQLRRMREAREDEDMDVTMDSDHSVEL
jgi:hypothetical protein